MLLPESPRSLPSGFSILRSLPKGAFLLRENARLDQKRTDTCLFYRTEWDKPDNYQHVSVRMLIGNNSQLVINFGTWFSEWIQYYYYQNFVANQISIRSCPSNRANDNDSRTPIESHTAKFSFWMQRNSSAKSSHKSRLRALITQCN